MAQALRIEQVTPADELRRLLSLVEKQVVSIRGSGAAAETLLDHLDRIAELWPELEAAGVDLRPEAGRWETVQRTVARNARPLLAELNRGSGIATLRAQRHPNGATGAWWQIDAQVAQQNKRRFVRTGLIAAIVLAAGVAVYVALRLLFPVDPNVQAAFEKQTAGERKIQQQGDFAGALADFSAATSYLPLDAATWLRVGAVQQKLGDTAGMAESYSRARALVTSDAEFKLGRSQIFLGFGMIDEAQSDIEAALALAPDNPYVFYTAASVYEAQGLQQEALYALERCTELADAQDNAQLIALARYRLGMLMQQGFAEQDAAPTPTAAPLP